MILRWVGCCFRRLVMRKVFIMKDSCRKTHSLQPLAVPVLAGQCVSSVSGIIISNTHYFLKTISVPIYHIFNVRAKTNPPTIPTIFLLNLLCSFRIYHYLFNYTSLKIKQTRYTSPHGIMIKQFNCIN